jgi:hypothetical protein
VSRDRIGHNQGTDRSHTAPFGRTDSRVSPCQRDLNSGAVKLGETLSRR